MQYFFVNTLQQFLDHLSANDLDLGRLGFRGVGSDDYDLIPSIGRKDVRESYDPGLEKLIFEKFRQMAPPFVATRPDNDITWLALARHHELPTRLLDWTLSPLVAAFFASTQTSDDKSISQNFAVYAYESGYFEANLQIKGLNPFELGPDSEEFVEVHADYYSDKMAAQRGFFTLHKHPDKPFREPSLMKFTFPSKSRVGMINQLDFYGINSASLFPDLDDLAAYWGWFYKIST
jgi:hypothetical protein